ncbi:putative immunoglobulin-blocking virulence protein [Mycoplasmopsis mucosicanis]|uniref:Putative immunoglobulin-blocking virulence protein n=1 Tax=Mycoplasmopsis mucosicanis TaxID=458208 RepID=A0A507SIH7_9BACT|nr:putative immunoglobulin-blocking virulence protein [Mycoplasmopsis mucosicanis]TQC51520.1 putative immunoglobulin-blocking virulence protein [Mycoplasmopsis mucosicanis]
MKKNRKLILFSLATASSLTISGAVGAASYFSLTDSSSKIRYNGGNTSIPILKNGDEFDISNSISGNNDSSDLKPKKTPETPKEDPNKPNKEKEDLEVNKSDQLDIKEEKNQNKPLVDKSKLQKTIADSQQFISEITNAKYQTIKDKLMKELEEANKVFNDPNATKEKVTEAEDKLSKALKLAKQEKEALDKPKPPIIHKKPSEPKPAPTPPIKSPKVPPKKKEETKKKEQDKKKQNQTPSKPQPQPPQKRETLGQVRRQIEIDGVLVDAIVEPPRERHDSPNDVKKGITNRKPYQNNAVGEVISVEVTEELRKAQVDKVKKVGNGTGLFDDFRLKSWTREPELNPNTPEGLKKLTKVLFLTENDRYNYQNLIHRYLRLLNSPKIKEFLLKEAQDQYESKIAEFQRDLENFQAEVKRFEEEAYADAAKYHKLPEDQKTDQAWEPIKKKFRELEEKKHELEGYKERKNVWLISNLDPNKFSKLAPRVDQDLKKGYSIDPNNAYINENGELDSYAFSPAPGFNSVTDRLSRDNKERRIFNFDSWYPLNGPDILNDKYPGWTNTDVTNDYKDKLGLPDAGVKLKSLRKDDGTKSGIILEIDASYDEAYKKAKDIIEKVKQQGIEITGYKIVNMGKLGRQNFKEILQALPEKIKLLKLFYEGFDTSDLIELENKEIDELGIYTTSNNIYDDIWTINPLSLRKVAWVNTNDFNAPGGYIGGYIPPSVIKFDGLSFDEGDYKYDANTGAIDYTNPASLQRINDGLRLAYWTRNNEPFFQGGFGPGLKPDHNEAGNSWPLGLDLSRTKHIRSLKGLQFNDIEGKNAGTRKLKRLKLYSQGEYFNIDVDDLNDGQFDTIMISQMPQMPKTKIWFSDKTTKKVKITSRKGIALAASGKANLQALFRWADQLDKDGYKVYVDRQETKQYLKDSGFIAELASDDINII